MSDLTYSVDLLHGLGQKLKSAAAELKDGKGSPHYSFNDVGHHRVVDALDHFRGNWNDNRDHVAEKMANVGDLAITAADGFDGADKKLAHKIHDMMQKGHHQ